MQARLSRLGLNLTVLFTLRCYFKLDVECFEFLPSTAQLAFYGKCFSLFEKYWKTTVYNQVWQSHIIHNNNNNNNNVIYNNIKIILLY